MGGGPPSDYLLCAVPGPEPKDITSRLRNKFPKVEIKWLDVSSSSKPATRTALPAHACKDVTILFTLFAFPDEQADAPSLELVQLLSAGSNQVQNTWIYDDKAIAIATASGIHGPQIAEWCLMTLLVHTHGYKGLYENQKQSLWKRPAEGVRDRVGTRVGILGYGSIGRQVGRLARAMGMEVVAYTATPKDTAEKRRDPGFIVPGTGDPEGEVPVEWYSGLDKGSLHDFLARDLDWIVVAVPLTEQTRHFLSTEEFGTLSKGGKGKPFVTNIARGPIIDQTALIEALKDGTLGGAALDVTDPEPLPEDSELWGLKNAIVTPHVSGSLENYTERALQLLEAQLERREKGEKLINVIDRDRGY